jgi:hypothetical protein
MLPVILAVQAILVHVNALILPLGFFFSFAILALSRGKFVSSLVTSKDFCE